MRNKITQYQKDFIKEFYENNGINFCIENLNLPKSTISSIARRLNLNVKKNIARKNMSKKNINIDDYKYVTDHRIAYILGLIWTDGHVSFANNNSKTPIVKHSCVTYDSMNSNSIFKELGWKSFESENKKSIGKNNMTINWISSRELGDYLINNNFRDKSKGTEIYKNICFSVLSHFLRGILDGDGCITISKSGKKYKQTAIYFSSTYDQDWYFLTKILDNLKIEYKHRLLVDNLGKSSQIYINKSQSINNLCEYIYKDSEFSRLERKYDKYQEFLNYKNSLN